MSCGPYDYISFDHDEWGAERKLKEYLEMLHAVIEDILVDGREKELVLAKLDEAYMWMGKALRDGRK